MYTTLNKIKKCRPCLGGWIKLLRHLGKTGPDDEPLSITTVLESNGLDDALWALRVLKWRDREKQLFAVKCARRVQHLVADQRSLNALDTAEAYANGAASLEELTEARKEAWEASAATDLLLETLAEKGESIWKARAADSAATAIWNAVSAENMLWGEYEDAGYCSSISAWEAASRAVMAAGEAAAMEAEVMDENRPVADAKDKASETERVFQAKLFAEIFSPERKD